MNIVEAKDSADDLQQSHSESLEFRTLSIVWNKQTKKQTPWPLVRKRTILTERPPLVDEI
jgi:hypothetical protein